MRKNYLGLNNLVVLKMKKKYIAIIYLVIIILLALFSLYVERYGKDTEKRIEEYKNKKNISSNSKSIVLISNP